MESLCSGNRKQSNTATSYVNFNEDEEETPCQLSLASFSLLNKYRKENTLIKRKLREEGDRSGWCNDQDLSVVEIIKLARGRYKSSSSQDSNDHSVFSNSSWAESSGLSEKDEERVELVELLLTCVDKFGDKQFDQAIEVLKIFTNLSPIHGDPLERLVYYFSGAIRDKISQETGQPTDEPTNVKTKAQYVENAVEKLEPALLAWLQEIPFAQVAMLTGIQAIVDAVSSAKKIHFIVFGIRTGVCTTALMQALAARFESPTELFKVTAVERATGSSGETGKRLTAFADSLGLNFVFKSVVISDLRDLNEDVFEVKADEATVVNFQWFLRTATPCPKGLEAVMRAIRNISPSIVVVSEMEASTGLPNLVDRFIEALVLHGSLFDCFEACMDRKNENRITFEGVYLGYGMRDLLKSEGEVKSSSHMKVDEYRDYFAKFGMFGTRLSSSSLFHAKLVAEKFHCGGFCTLGHNGESLLIGWKGTPIASVSAWKFKECHGGKSKYPIL